MSLKDVTDIEDLNHFIEQFYDSMLKDPIIGFIFTDVVKIELANHLPIIVNFWADVLFAKPLANEKPLANKKPLADEEPSAHKEPSNNRRYFGNTLQKHLEVHQALPLKPGHFTRWLHLFDTTLDKQHSGPNVELMKRRAEMVAKSISAAIDKQKRSEVHLALNSKLDP